MDFLFSQIKEMITSLQVTVAFVVGFIVFSLCIQLALQNFFKISRVWNHHFMNDTYYWWWKTYSLWKIRVSRYIIGLRYLFDGPATVQNAYQNVRSLGLMYSPNETEKIPGSRNPIHHHNPRNLHVLISSTELIPEFIDSPPSQLSLHAIAKEVSKPRISRRSNLIS